MTKKRNRTRPQVSLQERLVRFIEEARTAAKNVPVGPKRHSLLQKARDAEAAAKIERWLSSPGLKVGDNQATPDR
jgi:hypothetical protein